MSELLIVKGNSGYYRFADGEFFICGMNKASVFPLGQLAEVKRLCEMVKESGAEPKIMKLTISEELFEESR